MHTLFSLFHSTNFTCYLDHIVVFIKSFEVSRTWPRISNILTIFTRYFPFLKPKLFALHGKELCASLHMLFQNTLLVLLRLAGSWREIPSLSFRPKVVVLSFQTTAQIISFRSARAFTQLWGGWLILIPYYYHNLTRPFPLRTRFRPVPRWDRYQDSGILP